MKIGSREFRAVEKFLVCAKFRTVREIFLLHALQVFFTSSFSALDSFGFEGDLPQSFMLGPIRQKWYQEPAKTTKIATKSDQKYKRDLNVPIGLI